ncbi:MAG: transketolase [Synergistales bacterium]|nr:transketolase [Synergistales bacterium]
MEAERSRELSNIAAEVRKDVVRMISLAGTGDLSRSLALVDILVFLYWERLRVAPETPLEGGRDRFVLSDVLACPSLYAVLAGRGFFPRSELWSYARLGAMLQGVPTMRRTPGIDATPGFHGQGPGIAAGIALSLADVDPSPSVACLLDIRETQEGVFWESLRFSFQRRLGNLVLLVTLPQVEGAENARDSAGSILKEHCRILGCPTADMDGHDFSDMERVYTEKEGASAGGGMPLVLFADVRLGCGLGDRDAGRMLTLNGRPDVDWALREIESRRQREGGDGA